MTKDAIVASRISTLAEKSKEIINSAGYASAFEYLASAELPSDYLPRETSPSDLESAKETVASFLEIQADLDRDLERVTECQTKIKKLRKFPIFGKKRYLRKKEELTTLSAELTEGVAAQQTRLATARPAAEVSQRIVAAAEEEESRLSEAHERNSAKFDEQKGSIIAALVKAHFTKPLEGKDDWTALQPVMEGVLREDPVRTILPFLPSSVIPNLLPFCLQIMNFLPEWLEEPKVLIVGAEERRLGGKNGLYGEFVKTVVELDDENLRRDILYLILLCRYYYISALMVTPSDIVQALREAKPGVRSALSSALAQSEQNAKFLVPAKEAFLAGKELALEQGNEGLLNILNDLQVEAEEVFGPLDRWTAGTKA